MTEPAATWADATLGDMPGLGNDRPRGGAEIKPELDAGLAVVRYLYDNSRIDAEWSVHELRGFRWWADGLAQRVWCDPVFDDAGIDIFRVVAATELLHRVADVTAAARVVDTFNSLSAGSAIVLDPDAQTIGSVSSMWVHGGSRDWVARSFSVIAAIQIAQAQQQGMMLAPLVKGELALSEHPESGPRTEPDQMLGLLEIVKADGAARTRWAGEDLLSALRQVRELPIVVQATGDAVGIAIEVPYGQTTALIRLGTDEAHPGLGNGMVVRLSLPGDAGPGPEWAAMRNRQELESLTRAHFLGSWVGAAGFATFVSFYPNMLARTGIGAVNVALSTINRAMWMANLGRTSVADEGRTSAA